MYEGKMKSRIKILEKRKIIKTNKFYGVLTPIPLKDHPNQKKNIKLK